MRAWPHRPKTNLGAPTASSSDLVLGYRSPWHEDGQNGRYESLVSPPKAFRPPEATRGAQTTRGRRTSATIGGRDPRSRAAIRREEDEPCFLWIAEPACGSRSRLVDSSAARLLSGLGCHPRVSRLVGSTRGPVGSERPWPVRAQKASRGLGLASEFGLCVLAGRRRVATNHGTHTQGRRRATGPPPTPPRRGPSPLASVDSTRPTFA